MKVLAGLVGLLLLTLLLALGAGGEALRWQQVPGLLWRPEATAASEILFVLRLPRALAALATGALLGLAGALMQILLRNPLADPYVLGLSGGAALGALSALALGGGVWWVNGSAMAGALGVVVAVFVLARQDLAGQTDAAGVEASPRLLLIGVMLSSISMAGVSLILTLAPGEQLRGMLFWMLGDLSGAEPNAALLAAPVLICALCWPFGRDLNLLLRDPVAARLLGVPVRGLRRLIYGLASLAAALAVTSAGTIGFVGLVVPHALRLLLGNDQRLLLPACALGGAIFLLAADSLARTVMAPLMLPVGVITALVGAPLFIGLLLRPGGRR